MKEITGAGAASIAVLRRQHERLELRGRLGLGRRSGRRPRDGRQRNGIAGWSLASGQSITVSDAPSDPRFAADVAAATGYTPRRVFAIPLEADAGTVGVMEILDAEEGRTDAQNESRLVATLAHQAAVAIETTNLFQDLGRVLFTGRREGGGLRRSPRRRSRTIAERSRGPARELADLLDLFHEIGRLGPQERQTATDLLYTFLTYAQGIRELACVPPGRGRSNRARCARSTSIDAHCRSLATGRGAAARAPA